MSTEKANNISRRKILKKAAYTAPTVLTMAIAPVISTPVLANGKGKGKGKGPASVPEPGTLGILGLGLAAMAGKKAMSAKSDKNESDT